MTDQPDGIDPQGYDLPDPMNAAVRVGQFLEEFGDGRIDGCDAPYGIVPPLYARDLQALANAAAGIPGTLAAHDLTVRQVTTERDHLRIDLNTTEEHLTDARRERNALQARIDDVSKVIYDATAERTLPTIKAIVDALQGGQPARAENNEPLDAEPNACGACGAPERSHYRRYNAALGWHTHVEPTDAQRKARMLARQAERQVPQ